MSRHVSVSLSLSPRVWGAPLVIVLLGALTSLAMDSNFTDQYRSQGARGDPQLNQPSHHVGDASSSPARFQPAETEQSIRPFMTSALAGQSTTHREYMGTPEPTDAAAACLSSPTSYPRTEAEAALAAEASARVFPTLEAYASRFGRGDASGLAASGRAGHRPVGRSGHPRPRSAELWESGCYANMQEVGSFARSARFLKGPTQVSDRATGGEIVELDYSTFTCLSIPPSQVASETSSVAPRRTQTQERDRLIHR